MPEWQTYRNGERQTYQPLTYILTCKQTIHKQTTMTMRNTAARIKLQTEWQNNREMDRQTSRMEIENDRYLTDNNYNDKSSY